MKINFGNYTYFEDDGRTGTYIGTKGEWSGHYAFDENKFNKLIVELENKAKSWANIAIISSIAFIVTFISYICK